ncbi:MAG TPA: tetratricopeptide repeat protein, partial [Bacteroidales bacterium]|nr:tetratricopeptide repeat protein [Bacteroidales bacterium]
MKKFFQIAVIFAMAIFAGCSTQKNTLITRNYHSLISHYNIYFNGKESFKKGLTRINSEYKDNYNQLLNVFTYTDKELNSSVASEMDVAIKKASKVITLHSIKAKPNYKTNKLTPKEKEFVARSEYNTWVDESYMLIAKANFYKNDFDEATKTISVILKDFPKNQVRYEALIWQARIHLELNELNEAEKILSNLESDKKFPRKFTSDLNSTYAFFFIKKQQYKPAAQKLEKALETARGKHTKLRQTYILAQLYQLLNDEQRAITHYKQVVKMNPPYEMTFNARINLAGLVDVDSKGNKNIKAQLYKMLKDQKNKDFRDQIYFALANMELREKNEEKAIELYKESVAASTKNDQQKATTFVTLGDLYYGRKQYIPAQAYYDSSMQSLHPDFKDYDRVKARANNLTTLVTNLNTIELQDSLLHLASLNQNDRLRIVEGIIRDMRAREAETRQKEMLANQTYSQSNVRNVTSANNQGAWYFYNPTSVQQGMVEFQSKWGKRKLEDNWRRRNKGVNISTETAEVEGPAVAVQEKKVADNKTPEFYLQDIPLTDSAKNIAHNKIIEGYYAAANVYRNDLNEPAEAVKLYEELIRKYPDSQYTPSAYYQLYSTYNSTGNSAKAQQYKQLVLSKYPQSLYARVLSDPDYARKVDEEANKANHLYEETYNLYIAGNYQQVYANSDQALKQYKNSEVAPQFALLKALSMSKTSDVTSFRRELESVMSSYPGTEVSAAAKAIVLQLDNANPDVKKTEQTLKAEATYSQTDKAPILLAWLVAPNE